jgi:hypothetical protein
MSSYAGFDSKADPPMILIERGKVAYFHRYHYTPFRCVGNSTENH